MPRLYPTIRPGARYFASLRLLHQVKQLDPSIFTKSGLMVGLGETAHRDHAGDGRPARRPRSISSPSASTCSPRVKHAAIDRFVTPEEFADYAALARGKGFLLVSATPLTRSSYHADADFARAARGARARAQLRSRRERAPDSA